MISLVVILVAVLVLWTKRSGNWCGIPATQKAPSNSSDLTNLALLTPNKSLAKIGTVILRSEDLREVLEQEFHGPISHAGLSAQDLAARVGAALDLLIEDELLAEAARQQGMKTNLTGSIGRQDLARRYLDEALAKVPKPSDNDLRTFYKNHGEKFYIPPGAEVRELFLPLEADESKASHTPGKPKGASYSLGEQLATRIRNGESFEDLAKRHVADPYRDRANVHRFHGGVMSPEDESRVLALRPGDVTGPIRVEGGYAIFQCVARIRSGRIPFFEAQHKIETFLTEKGREDTRKGSIAELRQRIPVHRLITQPREVLASAE